MLLAISLTVLAMLSLKAFALDKRTLLRAMLILTVANYAVLKTTQDIRMPGELFMRQTLTTTLDNPKKQFILAKQLQRELSQSSNESSADEPSKVISQRSNERDRAGSAKGGLTTINPTPITAFQEDKTFIL